MNDKLINTKGDVEAACRIETFDGDDYLAYALHHIQAAIAKREDAPCSSAEHAKAAQVALQLERRPIYMDVVKQWHAEAQHQQDAARIADAEAKSVKWQEIAMKFQDKDDQLTALLASHAETIRQLTQDNEALKARVDSQRSLPPAGSTASTEGVIL